MQTQKHPMRLIFAYILLFAVIPGGLIGEQIGNAVKEGDSGKLEYERDKRGNRVPDFSHAGYQGGGVPIPHVPAKITVEPESGDDGNRIQAAIDYVSKLDPDSSGFRGAVQLLPGEYKVDGQLEIRRSGVILRGAGSDSKGTRIIATGKSRRTLIQVSGKDDLSYSGDSIPVTDAYVPVGSREISVESVKGLSTGQRIEITRPSTQSWIERIGMDTSPARTHYKWKPGKVDLRWEREIIQLNDNTLLLDAPLTTALDEAFGGAEIRKMSWPGRIRNVGIENLRCISTYDENNPVDESHSWMAIEMDFVEDGWIRDVTGKHFVSSIVDLGSKTRTITVQDCASLEPVSEQAGYRRHSFHTSGELTLFQRCRSEFGRSDFTVGYMAGGPNVFLDCETHKSTDLSGSIGSWASGILFDNVHIDGGRLGFDNLEIRYGGAGWAAANSVLWQCSASQIVCRSPKGALNWAIGVWGQFYGEGRWQNSNQFVNPDSLYRAQLKDRKGTKAVDALTQANYKNNTEDAESLESLVPDWKSQAEDQNSVNKSNGQMNLERGWLVNANGIMAGNSTPTSWWRGHLVPSRTGDHHPSITRFLPGRYGRGATDILDDLAARMIERNEILIRHHWGLWYDRRREDHQMIRRMTDDVWPPFYEQPYARSGKGTAWDGLSKYDLTKFNPWYFQRLHDFAEIAEAQGRVLVNEMYFQHNILESGAHWVDFPWRPVNAVQKTDFPEPPPFSGDTIKMSPVFYDLNHPLRKKLHRLYIRQCLENLSSQPNVIHTIGEEFTGPLHFVEFWLDVVKEWMNETGHDPLIALSVPKDIQDAILADPEREHLIDVIEIKYWFDTTDGLFAPKGGQQLAPRQHLRKWDGGRPENANVADMVREYRLKFPDKAVICPDLHGADGWAVLAGGGSFPALPESLEPEIKKSVKRLHPRSTNKTPEDAWILEDRHGPRLIYTESAQKIDLEDRANANGDIVIRSVDLKTGQFKKQKILPGKDRKLDIPEPTDGAAAYWVLDNSK